MNFIYSYEWCNFNTFKLCKRQQTTISHCAVALQSAGTTERRVPTRKISLHKLSFLSPFSKDNFFVFVFLHQFWWHVAWRDGAAHRMFKAPAWKQLASMVEPPVPQHCWPLLHPHCFLDVLEDAPQKKKNKKKTYGSIFAPPLLMHFPYYFPCLETITLSCAAWFSVSSTSKITSWSTASLRTSWTARVTGDQQDN